MEKGGKDIGKREHNSAYKYPANMGTGVEMAPKQAAWHAHRSHPLNEL